MPRSRDPSTSLSLAKSSSCRSSAVCIIAMCARQLDDCRDVFLRTEEGSTLQRDEEARSLRSVVCEAAGLQEAEAIAGVHVHEEREGVVLLVVVAIRAPRLACADHRLEMEPAPEVLTVAERPHVFVNPVEYVVLDVRATLGPDHHLAAQRTRFTPGRPRQLGANRVHRGKEGLERNELTLVRETARLPGLDVGREEVFGADAIR